MPTHPRRQHGIWAQIEQLEERVVMSAQGLGGAIDHHALSDPPPLSQHVVTDDSIGINHHDQGTPDFWIDYDNLPSFDEQLGDIDQFLWEAHNLTGWRQVQSDYGFSGAGQTVAVIDSGIAYDHYALGGGFGQGYRVVGGWDFTEENDGNPYDDGPSGSHGSHVAGIIGSDDSTHTGVATEVDLVGLRVFNDAGEGWFSWVEDALQWVHDHRNDFDNPITAVNLSLGVSSWNADSIPSWANLEEEFAQLEADGIFVAVSAGNSFTSYNEAGLSYPAASSYVVPVMSTDDSGLLSYFSQRHSRAIAAPGRSIYSTVPDYNGDNNGSTDDFRGKSGTSMAAPYVAGASVLVREAMEFVGMTDITQDVIYDHMIATADQFYDSATNAWYDRLNLEAAIDALMPSDDYGSSAQTAYDLGSVDSSMAMNGHIAALDDVDYFSFTAGVTGSVTFSASNLTHEMVASWQVYRAEPLGTQSIGDEISFAVEAGQSYSVSLASDDGLGYYNLDVTAEADFSFVDWGNLTTQETRSAIAVDGAAYYRLVAGQAGYVTVEALYDQGVVNVDLVNTNGQVVAAGAAGRADYYAQAGEEVFIRVSGSSADVDFRLTNALSVAGNTVSLVGTTGVDAVRFTAGDQTHTVSLNDVSYSFDAATYSDFDLTGSGDDALLGVGTSAADYATLTGTETQLSSNAYVFQGHGFRYTTFVGGVEDTANFVDTELDEIFVGRETASILRGNANEYVNRVNRFGVANAYANNGGYDKALIYDTPLDDTLTATQQQAVLVSSDASVRISARDFERTTSYSQNGGSDEALLHDSNYNDYFLAGPDHAVLRGMSYQYWNITYGFESVVANATNGGVDRVHMWGGLGNDVYTGGFESAILHDVANSYRLEANGFKHAIVHLENGGNDIVNFWDSELDDLFIFREEFSVLRGGSFEYSNVVYGADEVHGVASSSGVDTALLFDTLGDDDLTASGNAASLAGSGLLADATGFESVRAYSISGGSDDAAVDAVDFAMKLIGDWSE